jgi:glycosyltransferase involved in cell wall biosynthesis
VIPVYNHASNVGQVVKDALTLGFPVFAVDDGSTDTTFEILKNIAGITVLRHDKNLGKGAALLSGFHTAGRVADFAVTIDADGQHNPSDATKLIESIKPHLRPLVVGKREGMLTDPAIPWTSRFGRKFSNFWVRMAGGPRISDTQSGFRIYPLNEILNLKSKAGYFQFEIEILVLAHRKKIPIYEVPIHVTYPSAENRISHFRPFVDFWRNTMTFTRLIVLRLFTLFFKGGE